MSLYRLFAPLLYSSLDPERAHSLAISTLSRSPFARKPPSDDPSLEVSLWGKRFPNPVGLAAGMDKDGLAARAFFSSIFGFGFVEVGTVTPRPQQGNPRPRLFRLTKDRAIINRMGFNNAGIEDMAARFSEDRPCGVLGINLGKNKETLDAAADYEKGVYALSRFADYLVVNISSPNTPGLRDLQRPDQVRALLLRVRAALDKQRLENTPPLLLKIAPDLSDIQLSELLEAVIGGDKVLVDGIICTNTTLARPESLKSAEKREAGGLSGAPLKDPACEILRKTYRLVQGRVPLIGVGGISSGKEAYNRIRAGASLIQVYSALIYEGPGLIKQIKKELVANLKADGFTTIAEAVGKDVS